MEIVAKVIQVLPATSAASVSKGGKAMPVVPVLQHPNKVSTVLLENPARLEKADNEVESKVTGKFRAPALEDIKERTQAQVLTSHSALPYKANNTGLPDQLKNGIEHLGGYDMSDVKVHYNSSKPAQLKAHAYAQGTDIHLGPGQEQHLPHEAWHVVQQKQGRVRATLQKKGSIDVNNDKELESEADRIGHLAATSPFSKQFDLRNVPIPKIVHSGLGNVQQMNNLSDEPDEYSEEITPQIKKVSEWSNRNRAQVAPAENNPIQAPEPGPISDPGRRQAWADNNNNNIDSMNNAPRNIGNRANISHPSPEALPDPVGQIHPSLPSSRVNINAPELGQQAANSAVDRYTSNQFIEKMKEKANLLTSKPTKIQSQGINRATSGLKIAHKQAEDNNELFKKTYKTGENLSTTSTISGVASTLASFVPVAGHIASSALNVVSAATGYDAGKKHIEAAQILEQSNPELAAVNKRHGEEEKIQALASLIPIPLAPTIAKLINRKVNRKEINQENKSAIESKPVKDLGNKRGAFSIKQEEKDDSYEE